MHLDTLAPPADSLPVFLCRWPKCQHHAFGPQGFCRKHYQTRLERSPAGRVLASWQIDQLLDLDWTRPNHELGPRLGLKPHQVEDVRWLLRKRGQAIAKARTAQAIRSDPFEALRNPSGPERPIDKYLRAGLGRLSDERVAQDLGVSAESVTALRLALGLPTPRGQQGGSSQ